MPDQAGRAKYPVFDRLDLTAGRPAGNILALC